MADKNKKIPARGTKKPVAMATGSSLDIQAVAYRGAVPLRAFVGWVSLVIVATFLVGALAANLLVNQRLGQLVQETATRVELQAQGRASALTEWAASASSLGKTIENAEVIKIFTAESGKTSAAGAAAANDNVSSGMVNAVMAQTPYMDQLFNEFVQRNALEGAQLVLPDGKVLLSAGIVPETLSSDRAALQDVVKQARGQLRPLRVSHGQVVMDVVRPIMALGPDDKGPVVGVLWYTVPVGDKITALVAATRLDREGERTALLQHVGDKADVVGRSVLAPLNESFSEIENRLGAGGDAVRVVQTSLVDGKPVFATVRDITGTPFALLQEYTAREALGIMTLYKPGIYLIVSLLMVVLGALMLALTLHLMGQRNRTRVKLLGQTMDALVRVVEARDPYLSGHHTRVARMAVAAGNKLGLGVGERATLYYAAQLSSVGRMLVPRGVLAKKSKLNEAERTELEEHINQAVKILGDIEFDLPIVPIISQMYEREDGTGHPLGLKDGQISRMAKVLGACDAYVAMTSDRAHRKAMSKAEALKAMNSGAFAEDVVAAIKAER